MGMGFDLVSFVQKLQESKRSEKHSLSTITIRLDHEHIEMLNEVSRILGKGRTTWLRPIISAIAEQALQAVRNTKSDSSAA